jgi:ATP-dependent Clp protease ATP-binding subunit ClpC
MIRSRWIRVGALALMVIVAGGIWALQERTQPAAVFHHFTPEAKRVLQGASDEAQRHGHRHIDTSHLLAAFLAESRGAVTQALSAGSLDPVRATAPLQDFLAADPRRPDEEAGPTPEAKRVVEQSVVLARRLGGGDVRVEHLLLALLDVDSATAEGSLVEHRGGQPAIIRRALEDRLQRAYAKGPEHLPTGKFTSGMPSG